MQPDGLSLKLDSAGDTKAAELVRNDGKKSIYNVAVTGNANKNTINVDSIVIARPLPTHGRPVDLSQIFRIAVDQPRSLPDSCQT